MIQFKKIFGTLKIVAKVFWWGATILLAALIIVIFGAKLKGEVPYFFGYSVINIVSGSMEDTIPAGTYILIKKTDASDIKKDDIICFYSDDPSIKGYPNTHIVAEDPIITENGIEFVTRGEANPKNDDFTAKGDKLIGKYVKNLDGFTRFTTLLQGNGMFIVLMLLTGLTCVFMIVPIFIKAAEKNTSDDEDNENRPDSKT